jgi:succinoglycan biosynthesis protein ExoO
MKISVIIPTYNVKEYVNKCLDSVLRQTHSDLEVIVIDDGSSDGTREILQGYAENDSRIVYLKNKENLGPSGTRNRGLEIATGDYIALLDSDDWWGEDRISILSNYAQKFDADMICDDQLLVRDQSEKPWGTLFENAGYAVDAPARFDAYDFLNKNMGLKPLFKSQFLKRHGLRFDTNLRFGEDHLLFLQCLIKGAKAYIVPDSLYYYRARPDSLVTNQVKLYKQALETHNELLNDKELTKDAQMKEALLKRSRYLKESLAYYRVMEPIKNNKTSEGLKKLIINPFVLLIIVKRLPKVIKARRRK